MAEIEPIDWGLVPASHLTFAQVLDIGRVLVPTSWRGRRSTAPSSSRAPT
jgi:hypothetical protein